MKTRIIFPNIEVSQRVKAPQGALWDLLTDTTRWAEWGPSVVHVFCSDRRIQKGSQGRVKTALGLWVPFVITHFEPERYWSWQVFGIPATGHRVDALGRGLCRLAFEVPLFGAPYVMVCREAIIRIASMLRNCSP